MSWLLAFAGFAALIVLHEFGHFLAAKAVGMRVERFFLFFPPKLVSVRRGETEYGIGAIPLGGFVKISGMNPDEDLPDEVRTRAYYSQPVWKRVVVIAAGPFVNLVIAFVILFALGFGVQEATSNVGEIERDSPAAAENGLEPGDEIVAVDGVSGGAQQISEQLNEHACDGDSSPDGKPVDGCRAATPAEVTVIRDGGERVLSIRPAYDAELDRMRLGFAYAYRDANLSVPESAGWALDRMWFVTERTFDVITGIFDAEKREQISGVVGSYEVTRQSIEFDARQAIGILGVISLSLAVINLFPFLPLDGGHIFWALVEKLRGRPVSMRTMERAGVVGFALVLILFVIGLQNDIGRLTGEGFDVR